jgi:hypothetical protein
MAVAKAMPTCRLPPSPALSPVSPQDGERGWSHRHTVEGSDDAMPRANTRAREPNGEMYDPEHSGQIKTGGEWALQIPSASRVELRRHPPTRCTHALI